MNAPVDVKATTTAFFARTEEHLVSYLEACLHCGQCADACHFHQASGDPRHTPAYKLFPIAKAYRQARFPLNLFAPALTEADLTEWEELLFDTCTMCGRCTTICPMGIDIASIVGQARQAFVAAGLGPGDLLQAAENSRDHGSPLGVTPERLRDRLEWLAAMAKILNHAKVDWTLSTKGYESTNFGCLAGRSDISKIMTARLVEAAEGVGARTLIIPECGHAYGALRWGGANAMGRPLPFEVLHISEYMARLKREGKLKVTPLKGAITYHDPCQISRRGGAAEDARYLLEGFAEGFREMAPTGNYNWCCGGGGGVQAIGRAAELRHKVFRIKIDQVEATGAETLVSSCSNCRLTMDESKAALKWGGGLDSLVELIADHLVED